MKTKRTRKQPPTSIYYIHNSYLKEIKYRNLFRQTKLLEKRVFIIETFTIIRNRCIKKNVSIPKHVRFVYEHDSMRIKIHVNSYYGAYSTPSTRLYNTPVVVTL